MATECMNERCNKKLKVGKFVICMKCRMIAYCSEACLQKDSEYHRFRCFKEPPINDPNIENLRKIRDYVLEFIIEPPLRQYLISYNLKQTEKQIERFLIRLEIKNGACTDVGIEILRKTDFLDEQQKQWIETCTRPRTWCVFHLVIKDEKFIDMFDVIKYINFDDTESIVFPKSDEPSKIKEILSEKLLKVQQKKESS